MFRLSSFPTIRRASGPAVVLAAALTGSRGLTACGQGAEGSGTGAAEAPKHPAPTEAEIAALLASLPAP